MRRLRWILALVVLLACRPVAANAQTEAQQAVQSEPDRAQLFMEDDQAYYTAQVTRRSPYQRAVTYAVYFKGSADSVDIPRTTDGTIELLRSSVARLRRRIGPGEPAALRVCLDEVCRILPAAHYRATLSASRLQFSIDTDSVSMSGKEDVYVELPAGLVGIDSSGAGEFTPSPPLRSLLPRLGDRDNPQLGGVPLFRMNVSPLTQAGASAANALSVDFEGGIRRYRRASRYGLAYSGNVATEEEASLSSVKADLEYEHNLRPTSYLPVRLAAGAESDQSLEVANGVLSVRAMGLLPFNVNYSPRDEGYIPNTSPLVTATLEGGWNLRDERDDSGAQAAAAEEGHAPSRFVRPGYSFRWKVPVGRDLVVRLDHDGRWQYEGFFDGRPDFHPVWDAGLEYRLGGATYFVGYRRGEAPPLFRTIKATSVGLVFGVR